MGEQQKLMTLEIKLVRNLGNYESIHVGATMQEYYSDGADEEVVKRLLQVKVEGFVTQVIEENAEALQEA